MNFARSRASRFRIACGHKKAGLTTTPEQPDCRCFLPDLTGFAGARRMGPDRRQASPILLGGASKMKLRIATEKRLRKKAETAKSHADMKKHLPVPAIAAICAIFCSACAETPAEHTYWLKNSSTGTYSAHRARVELSPAEMDELGLVEDLPEDAKTTD